MGSLAALTVNDINSTGAVDSNKKVNFITKWKAHIAGVIVAVIASELNDISQDKIKKQNKERKRIFQKNASGGVPVVQMGSRADRARERKQQREKRKQGSTR